MNSFPTYWMNFYPCAMWKAQIQTVWSVAWIRQQKQNKISVFCDKWTLPTTSVATLPGVTFHSTHVIAIMWTPSSVILLIWSHSQASWSITKWWCLRGIITFQSRTCNDEISRLISSHHRIWYTFTKSSCVGQLWLFETGKQPSLSEGYIWNLTFSTD